VAAQNESQTDTAPQADQKTRGTRRTITGTVTSTKMDKTVVVTVSRRYRDKRFHKFISRRVRYQAHDEKNGCQVGDLVELVESRPFSKTKRWRVSRTVSKAKEGEQ
jgi:small subunit ribosomal protein S17